MTHIKELREKIEIARNNLNKSLENCENLQESYEENLRLDRLIEEYIQAYDQHLQDS
ncbi:MAG TPA: hypothetical protein IAC41_11160 [Candidatus Merdenecus merdavium]|nr:hypothetical protein [Candidatus Merdenecus merdavium]